MKAIDQLEYQLANEVLRLEITYSNLYRAYLSENKNEMISAIVNALTNNPSHVALLQGSMDRIFTENYGSNRGKSNWLLVSNQDVKLNVEECMQTIHARLSDITFYKNNYTYAQKILYKPNLTFYSNDILYNDSKGQLLKVSDFLVVSKYAISIAESIEPNNEEFAKANAVITTLQGIDAILNNKPEDKPVNKMLHLAISFISSVVKSPIKNDETKRNVTITSTMIDLVIDFFVKNRNAQWINP